MGNSSTFSLWHVLVVAIMMLLEAQGLGEGLAQKVVYAVNCGGESHVDIFGIRYARDSNQVGTASDFGKQLIISRVPQPDQILYQTERYHSSTFGYDIPMTENGPYLLILKFSEVYFTSPNMKVFDIVLNGDLTVASDLDIYERVGRAVAFDEYVEFVVKDGKILYDGEESEITAGKIRVEFVKSYRDNPKINAIVLVKGRLEDWPKLPPVLVEPEEEDLNGDGPQERGDPKKVRNPSGPKAKDPYAENDDTSAFLPIFVAVGAFIPLIFCLCKL